MVRLDGPRGWGGRHSKDGSSATSPVFDMGLAVRRLKDRNASTPYSRVPTRSASTPAARAGSEAVAEVEKGGVLTDATRTVMVSSTAATVGRSVTWGIEGVLPSVPHGVWLNKGTDDERYLGATFSNVPVQSGDAFTRPSAGGGGFGDPLERPVDDVHEDVIDQYVSVERAELDYGVALDTGDRRRA